jgi:outer membrane protein OmpA-like peptidoglycan-associated protein
LIDRKSGSGGGPKPSTPEEYQRLRRILVGRDLDELEMLRARLDEPELRSEEVARILARSVKISNATSSELRKSMQPVIEEGMRGFARRDPAGFSDLLFPSIGASVRKAVAAAMRNLMDALSRTVEQSVSLKSLHWRWEAIRTGKTYSEIVLLRSALFRVEQVFLIHRDTGILIEHRAADAGIARDATLVTSMLTVIRDFVQDSFATQSKDELETIQFGDTSIWIQSGPRALLACAVSGAAPGSLRDVLQENLEHIHFSHYEALEQFRGDVSKFVETRPRLDACMLGRAAESQRNRPIRWQPWAIGIAVLLAAAVYWEWQDRSKWSSYLSLLRAEPGLTVTGESRGWGFYRVEGLRDPMAADPKTILARTPLDASRVQQTWNPYLSLDTRFEIRRTVESLQQNLSRRMLRFETGKYVPAEPDQDELETIAGEIQELLRVANRGNIQVYIAIAGHADAVGDPKTNADLIRNRATWTRQALIRMGVPSNAVAEDLAAGERSYAKRRVTFRAVIGNGSGS